MCSNAHCPVKAICGEQTPRTALALASAGGGTRTELVNCLLLLCILCLNAHCSLGFFPPLQQSNRIGLFGENKIFFIKCLNTGTKNDKVMVTKSKYNQVTSKYNITLMFLAIPCKLCSKNVEICYFVCSLSILPWTL